MKKYINLLGPKILRLIFRQDCIIPKEKVMYTNIFFVANLKNKKFSYPSGPLAIMYLFFIKCGHKFILSLIHARPAGGLSV